MVVELDARVPLDVAHCTGIPDPRELPFASVKVACSVAEAAPLAAMLAGLAVKLATRALAGFPETVTDVDAVLPLPTLPVRVPTPAKFEVNELVALPSAPVVLVLEPSAPKEVPQDTTIPDPSWFP